MKLSEADIKAYLTDKPRQKQLYRSFQDVSRESSMVIWYDRAKETNDLQQVIIGLKGRIARIPSMKNSKIPGFNFPTRDVLTRVKAMDAHYRAIVCPYEKFTFGSTPVMLIVICGNRNRRFDPGNCVTTISDWLEPPSKKVGKGRRRGWGVSLINDDRHVAGFGCYGHQVGFEGEDSIVIIRRWSAVSDVVKTLVQPSLEIYSQIGNSNENSKG